jgi:hypothetical protein
LELVSKPHIAIFFIFFKSFLNRALTFDFYFDALHQQFALKILISGAHQGMKNLDFIQYRLSAIPVRKGGDSGKERDCWRDIENEHEDKPRRN